METKRFAPSWVDGAQLASKYGVEVSNEKDLSGSKGLKTGVTTKK
jgi:hypothetical protein